MTFILHNTSNVVMRSTFAVLMTVVLIATVAGCPLMACAFAPGSSHACCHKHQNGRTPCGSETEMQQCAYSLLEHSRTAAPVAALAPAITAAFNQPDRAFSAVSDRLPVRLADSAGLYLRLRVLLV